MKCGLNLFSLRSMLKTKQSFSETCFKLKDMGYDYLQFSGAPFDAEQIAEVSRQTGLSFVLTHVPMADILQRPDWLMEQHKLFGCKNIGLGMMPLDILRDEQKCLETIDALDEYGGGDVCDYLKKMNGKIECVHLKDYKICLDEKGAFVPKFAPLGEGNLDLPKIISVAKQSGAEYFLVEQDNAVDFADPLSQVKISVDYLKNFNL